MKKEPINNVSNHGATDIAREQPYVVEAEIVGAAPFMFHAWSVDAVAEKAKAKKGSAAKKSDNIESYVYRDDAGVLCIPGEYIRQSIIHAAKFRQDPRSPRKSAMDLFKAGVVSLTELCPLGVKDWDYVDRRRVVVQRNGITRERPAMRVGWTVRCELQVLTPDYIDEAMLQDVLGQAGRLVGIGDFRPTYGRYRVTSFQVQAEEASEAA